MNLKILLTKPKDKIILIFFIGSLIFVLIFLVIFQILLVQFPAGAGLFDMKNAWNKANMDKIISIWAADSLYKFVDLMILVHIVDLGFMTSYGIAIFTGLLIVARNFTTSPRLQNFYLGLSIISLGSVLFDLLEEFFILKMLGNPLNITERDAFGASLSALLCIIVLYSCIAFLLIGFVILLIKKMKK